MSASTFDARDPIPIAHVKGGAPAAPPRTFRLAETLDRFNDDHELVVELAAMLSVTVPESVRALETAVQAADWPSAARHAHTMHGAAGHLSAAQVCALADGIERAARAGGHGCTADVIAVFRAAVNEFAEEARAWANAQGPGPGKEAPCAS